MTTENNAPRMTDITVNYSIGAKVQLVKYEFTADVHLSRTEKYNVEGMTAEEIEAFYQERYEALRQQLGEQIEFEVEEMTAK